MTSSYKGGRIGDNVSYRLLPAVKITTIVLRSFLSTYFLRLVFRIASCIGEWFKQRMMRLFEGQGDTRCDAYKSFVATMNPSYWLYNTRCLNEFLPQLRFKPDYAHVYSICSLLYTRV